MIHNGGGLLSKTDAFLTKNPNDPDFWSSYPPPPPLRWKICGQDPCQWFEVNGFQIKPCFQDGCKYREMSRTGSSEEDFSALSEQENACNCTVETKEEEKKKDFDL